MSSTQPREMLYELVCAGAKPKQEDGLELTMVVKCLKNTCAMQTQTTTTTTTTTEITTYCLRVALQTDAVRWWRFIFAHWRQFMCIVGCDSVFVFIVQFAHSKLSVMPKFIRYMLYSVAKICQIFGQSDAKSGLMKDCDQNFLVMHRENLNVVEVDTRKPAVSSIPWPPVTYLSSTSRNMMEYYGKRQKGEAASTNMIMTVSHIVRGLASDLRGRRGGLPKNKLSSLEQRVSTAAGRGVCRPPPRPPWQTPTLALWCLCVFVNEEILVPWWDIALSWADSASFLPSAPLDSHTTIRHPIRPLASSCLHLVEVLEVEYRHKTLVILASKIQLATDGGWDSFFCHCDY